jgi:hypothetical protein
MDVSQVDVVPELMQEDLPEELREEATGIPLLTMLHKQSDRSCLGTVIPQDLPLSSVRRGVGCLGSEDDVLEFIMDQLLQAPPLEEVLQIVQP